MLIQAALILAPGLPHAAIYASLLALFGSSLRPEREPIVTTFVRRIHGSPSAEVRRYTRAVTWAWCGFFAAQILASALLLTLAPWSWWSLFVTLLNAPLIVLMFAAERLIRQFLLTDPPHEGWDELMRMMKLLKSDLS